MFAIKRAINGISINGDEWLLNPDGSTMLFNTYGEADALLALNNIEADIVDMVSYEKEKTNDSEKLDL